MPGWAIAGKLLMYGSAFVPFVAYGLAEQRRLFRLRRAHRVRLEDAEPNQLVFVRGRVVDSDGSMTAPISGRQCVAWKVGVSVRSDPLSEASGKYSESRELVVDDGSARVLVPAIAATPNLMLDLSGYHHPVSRRFPVAPAIRRFLEEHRFWGHTRRGCDLHEGILARGSDVAVVGVLRSRRDDHQSQGHYRTNAQGPRRELSFDSKRLIVTNLPRFLAP